MRDEKNVSEILKDVAPVPPRIRMDWYREYSPFRAGAILVRERRIDCAVILQRVVSLLHHLENFLPMKKGEGLVWVRK
jgi:hypothetical protein